jgi:hypothetical protein
MFITKINVSIPKIKINFLIRYTQIFVTARYFVCVRARACVCFMCIYAYVCVCVCVHILDILRPYNSIFQHLDPFYFSIRISSCFVGGCNYEPREQKKI